MTQKIDIGDLRLDGMSDLCVLKDGPPPFSFERDLQLSEAAPVVHYQSPPVDTHTYWGPK